MPSAVRTTRVILAALLCAVAAPLAAQDIAAAARDRTPPPWFASLSMGYGRLDVRSDQARLHEKRTFTMAFRVGRSVGDRLRLGVDLGGWLVEPADYNDPAKGIGVSETAIVAQFFPAPRRPFFIEAGGGLAHYTNHTPDGFDGDGVGWSIGAGWEHRLRDRVRIVPTVHWSGGRFRDTRNVLIDRTGLRFGALDVRVGGVAFFGRRDRLRTPAIP